MAGGTGPLQPSLFPFALIGIRSRAWWITLGVGVLVSVAFAGLWFDWLTALENVRGAGLGYSLQEVPMVLLPIIAAMPVNRWRFWLAQRRRQADPSISVIQRVGARVGLAAGAVVFAVYLGLWGALIGSGGSDGADFTAFYTGWTIVAEGDGANLYDPAVQAEVQQRILGGRAFESGLNPFNNPPHLVLPFVPLSALPLGTAYLVWALGQLGLLGWLLWRLLTRVAGDWTRDERILLVGATVAAPPLALTLLQGSLSLLVTVALLELYLALRAGGAKAGAAWLVAASVKPQAVLATGMALLAARRWRILGFALAGGAILAALATLVLGVGIWAAYFQFLGDYVGSFDVFSVRPSVMWNLRGTLALLNGPDVSAGEAAWINTIALVGQLAALAAVAWLWRGRWNSESPAFALRFALTLVLGLLFSPHLNPHDDLLLVPAAAIAYGAIRTDRHGRRAGLAMFATPFVVLLTNPLSVNEVGGGPVRTPVLLMLVFAGWLAVELRARHGESPSVGSER